jgi:hypothetical protein
LRGAKLQRRLCRPLEQSAGEERARLKDSKGRKPQPSAPQEALEACDS